MRSVKSVLCWSAMAALLVVNIGCGTLMGGTKQAVKVQSTPDGAQVTVERADLSGTTPTTLQIPRKMRSYLTLHKEGYETKKVELTRGTRTGIFILDILPLIIGASIAGTPNLNETTAGIALAGTGLGIIVVDAVTGGLFGFKEDYIEVALNKVSSRMDGPDTIRVGLLLEKGPKGQSQLRATAPVPVRLTVESRE